MDNVLRIIKGTNKPISFTFSEAVDFTAIEISLRNIKGEMQHWSLDDVEIVEKTIVAPLTEAETIEYYAGPCFLELKWMSEESVTEFAEIIRAEIVNREDTTLLGGSDE